MSNKQGGRDAAIVAEYRLLNALIHNSAYRNDSRIYDEMFLHETAKSLYHAILRLDQDEIPLSEASLLQAGNEIDYSVTKAIVDAVYNIDVGASTLDDIIVTLSAEKTRVAVAAKLRELQKVIDKSGALNQEEIVRHLFDVDLLLKQGGIQSPLKDFAQWSDQYIDELRQRATGKTYPYGDELLDNELLKGAYPGAITTLAASTGQGKSSYVLNIVNSLINMNVPCIYVTLEMSAIDTYDRLISLRRRIPLHDLYSHDAATINSIITVVEEERRELQNNKNFYLVDEPSLSLARLRALVKEFKQRTKNEYVLVFVDLATQLRDFTKSSSGMNLANSIEVAMNEANAIAKELGIHFVFVVQFNRDADNYKVSTLEDLEVLRPSLNNIKNSQAIAERSRVVLGAFRKKYYADKFLQHIPEAAELADIMEIQILKSSNSAVGKILKYYFDGAFYSITAMLDDDKALPVDIEY